MSRKVLDLTGKKFGRLLVINRDGYIQKNTKQPTWLCLCDCGKSKVVIGANLRNGVTNSCGCIKVFNSSTHHMGGSPEHQTWRGMKERCTNPNNSHYKMYGGKGITIHPEWFDFSNFYKDMGPRPEGTTLDRFPDRCGNYEPCNCRWAYPHEQSRNTSRTRFIGFMGETKCLKDWASHIGISERALSWRLKNWEIKKAMTRVPNLRDGDETE